MTILGENSSNLQAMEALKGNYEKDSNVKIDFKPNTFEDAFNKANQDFANGTGIYDIVLQYNFSLSSFVRNGYVYNIDELSKDISTEQKQFENDLFPNAWQEVGYYYKNPAVPSEGTIKIGYPFAANTMVLVYNREMFENADNKALYKKTYKEELTVPTDWQQYRRVAKFFTNPGKKTFGVCLQGAGGGWLYYEYCDFLFGMGGTVFEKQRGWEGEANTPLKITSPEAVAATDFYKSLKPYNAGNFTAIDATEQTKLMKNGNIAMAFVWSDYLYGFTFAEGGKADDQFGFTTLPGSKSPLAGGCYYINKKAKHPQEALKYVISLMQNQNQVALAKKGLCSPLKSTYDDPEVQKIPYASALKNSLQRGVYMFEAGPESDLVNQALTNYLQQLWADKLTTKEALEHASEDIIKGREEIYKKLKH
ncbi:MAG: extracellular solute-binding protein [Bacteroidetes bacterium]|nr:extracellular solute-binding protein [Bacteroidota bacterium]